MVTIPFQFAGRRLGLGPVPAKTLGRIWGTSPLPRSAESACWEALSALPEQERLQRLAWELDSALCGAKQAGDDADDALLGLASAMYEFGTASLRVGTPALGNRAARRVFRSATERFCRWCFASRSAQSMEHYCDSMGLLPTAEHFLESPDGIWLEIYANAMRITVADMYAALGSTRPRSSLEEHELRDGAMRLRLLREAIAAAFAVSSSVPEVPIEPAMGLDPNDEIDAEAVELYESWIRSGVHPLTGLARRMHRLVDSMRGSGLSRAKIRTRILGHFEGTDRAGSDNEFLILLTRCSVDRALMADSPTTT